MSKRSQCAVRVSMASARWREHCGMGSTSERWRMRAPMRGGASSAASMVSALAGRCGQHGRARTACVGASAAAWAARASAARARASSGVWRRARELQHGGAGKATEASRAASECTRRPAERAGSSVAGEAHAIEKTGFFPMPKSSFLGTSVQAETSFPSEEMFPLFFLSFLFN